MSDEYKTCASCAYREIGSNPTYCAAWRQEISNKPGNDDFKKYYNKSGNNGCPKYGSRD